MPTNETTRAGGYLGDALSSLRLKLHADQERLL